MECKENTKRKISRHWFYSTTSQTYNWSSLISNYFITRTAGAYGPLVLAPAEGVGALWAPLPFCFFVFFFWLLFFFTYLTFFFFDFFDFFLLFFNFFSFLFYFYFFTFLTFYHTFYHKFYHKPLPVLPSTPPQRFLYLTETQVHVLRGLQRFWGGCEDLATILERRSRRRRSRTDNSVLAFWLSCSCNMEIFFSCL